ncbi:SHOCT domain-containing protein [Ornithinimicrobium sp. W1665]|uniref:SHOCT domain-containing protein n=1 Tax=Ornithinimicrobium sp. W1665 TaxID=3416666 RepID=UPI003CE69FAC
MREQTSGWPVEDTAYVDPKVQWLLPVARQSLRLNLLPGEQVLGVFPVTRFRRSVALLVVTDRRLLTLGDQHVGMPVVDEVDRARVTDVRIERQKVFSAGLVTAVTDEDEVNLGTLTFTGQTFNRLEEVLARTGSGGMPVIPVVAPPLAGGDREDGSPQDDVPAPRPGGPRARSDHPLVVHLAALADLHERGALTDEEFAAAKARLLADPQG